MCVKVKEEIESESESDLPTVQFAKWMSSIAISDW